MADIEMSGVAEALSPQLSPRYAELARSASAYAFIAEVELYIANMDIYEYEQVNGANDATPDSLTEAVLHGIRLQREHDLNVVGAVAKVFGRKTDVQDAAEMPIFRSYLVQPERDNTFVIELGSQYHELRDEVTAASTYAANELNRATDAEASAMFPMHTDSSPQVVAWFTQKRQRAEKDLNVVSAASRPFGVGAEYIGTEEATETPHA